MKREPNELFKDYKERRKIDKEKTEKKVKGKIIWSSKQQGTYRKDFYGDIGSRRQ